MNWRISYRITQERTRHLTHVLLVLVGCAYARVRGLPSRYITLLNEARGETSAEIIYRDRPTDTVGVR